MTENPNAPLSDEAAKCYQDRNRAVVAFAVAVEKLTDDGPRSGQAPRACWSTCDDADDADADEWAIVYIWLNGLQVSWHVPRRQAERSRLPEKNVEWDGHTRAEKNHRLVNYARGCNLGNL